MDHLRSRRDPQLAAVLAVGAIFHSGRPRRVRRLRGPGRLSGVAVIGMAGDPDLLLDVVERQVPVEDHARVAEAGVGATLVVDLEEADPGQFGGELDTVLVVLGLPRDPQGLADGILRVLEPEGRAAEMGAAARLRLQERFTLERSITETERVLESIVAGPGRR